MISSVASAKTIEGVGAGYKEKLKLILLMREMRLKG